MTSLLADCPVYVGVREVCKLSQPFTKPGMFDKWSSTFNLQKLLVKPSEIYYSLYLKNILPSIPWFHLVSVEI